MNQNKPSKVTLRSLAAELGVAPATVMRALGNRKNVSPEMRRHIIEYANKSGYRLPGERQRSVALIISAFQLTGYIALMLEHLGRELENAGFQPEILTRKTLDRLKEFSFAGAISLEILPGLEKYWSQEYAIPLVELNMPGYSFGGIYSVCSDENALIGTALDYLYTLGHRKIGVFLVNTEQNPTMKEREEISRRFFRAKNISNQCFIGISDKDISIADLTDEAVSRGITAILGASEYMGHEILCRLSLRKVKVPEMCSVIGLELENLSRYFVPPLTTVTQDFRLLAVTAVEQLKSQIQNSGTMQNILVPGHLIERASCTVPPNLQ